MRAESSDGGDASGLAGGADHGLRVNLLGEPEAFLDGHRLSFPTRATLALFAYLVVERTMHRREKLAALLWPDSDERAARAALRTTLARLRAALRAVGEPLVGAVGAVGIEPQWRCQLDLERVAEAQRKDDPAALHAALQVYRGDFLHAFSVDGSPEFDDWTAMQRTAWRQRLDTVFARLSARQLGSGQDTAALLTLQRWIAHDPLRELAYRRLIELHARAGDRAAMRRVYESCERALSEELGIAPSPETVGCLRLDPTHPSAPSADRRAATAAGRRAERDRDRHRRGEGGDGAARAAAKPERSLERSRPSIAVLPFANLGGDPDQLYFADGLAEDIGATLALVPDIRVAPRQSVADHRSGARDARAIARELGVRHVLEGSVRRAGGRLESVVELIDSTAPADGVVWSERFERATDELFRVQDEITRSVTVALAVELSEGTAYAMSRRPVAELEAWECVFRGLPHMRRVNRRDNVIARRFYERSVEIAGENALSSTLLAWVHLNDGRFRWSSAPERSLALARRQARRAIALGDEGRSVDAHGCLAILALLDRRHAEALDLAERAVRSAPDNPNLAMYLAQILNYADRADEALPHAEAAMRTGPGCPHWYLGILAQTHLLRGDARRAVDVLLVAIDREPESVGDHANLAIGYAMLGRAREARRIVTRLRCIDEDYSARDYVRDRPYADSRVSARLGRLLREAGLA